MRHSCECVAAVSQFQRAEANVLSLEQWYGRCNELHTKAVRAGSALAFGAVAPTS